MNSTADKIRIELATLSEAERTQLAHFLIESLDPETDADAHAAWDVELERRAEEIKSGRTKGEPAEKVFTELRAKYS